MQLEHSLTYIKILFSIYKTYIYINIYKTLFSIYKNELKWIKNFNVRPDTLKLHEENIGRTLFDINHSNIFLYLSPTVMEIKTKQTNKKPTGN